MKKSDRDLCIAMLSDPEYLRALTSHFPGSENDAAQEIHLRLLRSKRDVVKDPLAHLQSIVLDVRAEMTAQNDLPYKAADALHPRKQVDPLEAAEQTSELLHRHRLVARMTHWRDAQILALRGVGYTGKEIAGRVLRSPDAVKKSFAKTKASLAKLVSGDTSLSRGGAAAKNRQPSAEETAPCGNNPDAEHA